MRTKPSARQWSAPWESAPRTRLRRRVSILPLPATERTFLCATRVLAFHGMRLLRSLRWGIELTIPRFGQRTLEDGSILPGLAEHQAEAVGTGDDFAKSEDRYKEFIASGLPLAKAFAECWEHMRTETGAL